MSDMARFLPLSNGPRDNGDAVSADRRAQVAQVVRLAAEHSPGDDAARAAFLREAGLRVPARSTARTPDDLAQLADVVAIGPKQSLRDLVRAVRALLVLAGDDDAGLPQQISGAVALAASTTASFDRRAAIAGRTVRAVDAAWTIGRGPELVAPAQQIVAFLLGVSDTAPRRPAA